jgi:hypothetical protein
MERCVLLYNEEYQVELRLYVTREECFFRAVELLRYDKRLPTYEEATSVLTQLLAPGTKFRKGALDNDDYYSRIVPRPRPMRDYDWLDGQDPEDYPDDHFAIHVAVDCPPLPPGPATQLKGSPDPDLATIRLLDEGD